MYPVVKALLFLISLLPLPVLYVKSSVLSWLLQHIFRYRKTVVFDNLRKSFPEKSEDEIRVIARAFYLHFTDVVVETIKLLSMSRANLLRRVKHINPEAFPQMVAHGGGGIGIFSHYANWEWLGAAMGPAAPFSAAGVYMPLKSKLFDRLMLHIRKRMGNDMVRAQDSFREAIKRLKQPYYFAILGDQTPMRSGPLYFSSLLGRPAAMHLGIAAIALKLQCPVYYIDIRRIRRGHYSVEFIRLPVENFYPYNDENVRRFTDYHVRVLENIIRTEPAYWLWSHRRWKRKIEPGDTVSPYIK
jgi:Kdo2-lipid IVA lauroyltransferase/acyltransferase